MRILILLLLSMAVARNGHSQIDTAFIRQMKSIDTANTLRIDTAAAPQDALTARIRELRSVRKGLNAQSVLYLKIREEQAKDTSRPAAFYDALLKEITTGKTGTMLETCLVNLYRQNFSIDEIKDLTAFYKTSAGQKMDAVFILLIVRSMKDAEQLLKLAAQKVSVGDGSEVQKKGF